MKMNNEKIKKAIVIGATSGIGKGLAEIFVRENYIVGITGRRSELLDALKSKNPNAYRTKPFDIKDTDKVVDNLEELTKQLGGLDLIVISSGAGDLNESLDFEIEKEAIATNVSGFTSVADWAFNYFQKQKHGYLAAISSVAGLRGSRQAPAYNATKAFQINYLEGLRQKAKILKIPIYITDIRPGLVNTDMAKGEGLFWVMPVDKVVSQIYNAIKKGKKVAYVTKRWCFIAFVLKIIPRFIYDNM
jgi:short-subunit dehydrogenase